MTPERELRERLTAMQDAAEMLWVVLANVSGGDWSKQNEEWQKAAARWRDNYFKTLTACKAACKAAPAPTPAPPTFLTCLSCGLPEPSCKCNPNPANENQAMGAPAEPVVPEREPLTHTRSCPMLNPVSDEACTCGLEWRIKLQTEIEMHNAWRKRAEEAEKLFPLVQLVSHDHSKSNYPGAATCIRCAMDAAIKGGAA